MLEGEKKRGGECEFYFTGFFLRGKKWWCSRSWIRSHQEKQGGRLGNLTGRKRYDLIPLYGHVPISIVDRRLDRLQFAAGIVSCSETFQSGCVFDHAG